MAYTQAQLTALEVALAQGASRVRYGDKEVQYRSLEEMRLLRDEMRAELGLASTKRGRRAFAEHHRGT